MMLKIRTGERGRQEVEHIRLESVKCVRVWPINGRERRNVVFECGCYLSPEDAFESTCPLHDMPMRLCSLDYEDLAWARRELSIHGVFGVDDLDNEG